MKKYVLQGTANFLSTTFNNKQNPDIYYVIKGQQKEAIKNHSKEKRDSLIYKKIYERQKNVIYVCIQLIQT